MSTQFIGMELSGTDNSYDCMSKKIQKLEQNNKADSHVLLGTVDLLLFIVNFVYRM